MISSSLIHKAMPALLAGMALFFLSCRAQLPVVPAQKPVETPPLISQAETYEKHGRLDAALQSYEIYLTENPTGPYATVAMHGAARAAMQRGDYQKAIDYDRKIIATAPTYSASTEVRYELSRALYLKGDYQASSEELMGWLTQYPDHPLRTQALMLLGEDYNAMGNLSQTLFWWLKAEASLPPGNPNADEIHRKILALIDRAGLKQIERMSPYTNDPRYLEPIQYRLALLYMENHQLEKASQIAQTLSQQSRNPDMAAKARELLKKIESAITVQPNVVGCLLPLSGPYSIYGQEILNGMQLALGIFSPERRASNLELVIKDSAGNPENGLKGLEELAKVDRAIAVVGPLASREASAVASKAQELQVPLITLTQKSGIAEQGDWIFQDMLTPQREVERLTDVVMGEFGLRRFAILYPDNPYGRALSELFWDQATKKGGEITIMESYLPDQTDFSNQIKKMTGRAGEEPHKGPAAERSMPMLDFEAVFLPDSPQTVAMIAPQLVYHDVVGVKLLGTSLWQSPRLIELAGDYLQGAIFPASFFTESEDPHVQTFVRDYKNLYGTAPGILAATGYDTIMLLSSLLTGAELTDRDSLRRALLSVRDFEGVLGRTSFGADGQVIRAPLLLTITGGRMEPLH